MKNLSLNILIFSACFTMMVSCSKSPETDLKGHYNGKNLFIQNPYGPEGVGFCVVEVKVNGRTTADEVNSAAFEVDLSSMSLKEGDEVEVELLHKKGCEPKVLNPEVLH